MQKDIAKAVSTFEDRQKVEAVASEMGYSLAELIGIDRKKTARAPAPAKYRTRENPALTWSGRGRRPQWFVDALTAGKTPADLAIC
jgi:DNA-binding protein H-NS